MKLTPTGAWLVQGAPGATSPQETMDGACRRLRDEGIPVDRAEAFVRTLHPNISGRSFVWHSDRPVEVIEHTYAFLQSEEFRRSVVAEVCRTGAPVRRRAAAGEAMVEPPHVEMTGFNRTDGETKVVIFYVSAPDTPFLDLLH